MGNLLVYYLLYYLLYYVLILRYYLHVLFLQTIPLSNSLSIAIVKRQQCQLWHYRRLKVNSYKFSITIHQYFGSKIFVICEATSESITPRILALADVSIPFRILATRSRLSVIISKIAAASLGFISEYAFA